MKSEKTINILFILLSIYTIAPWVPWLHNTYIEWVINFTLLALVICNVWREKQIGQFDESYKTTWLFLIWAFIGAIRGFFEMEIVMDLRWLMEGVQMLSLPLFALYFQKPEVVQRFERTWMKWGIIVFFAFIFWIAGVSRLYLGPFLLFGLFLLELPQKWMILFSFFIVAILMQFSNRAGMMIAAVCLFSSVSYHFLHVTDKMVKIAHIVCYILPIVLLVLGILGIFNIFSDLESNKGKYTTEVVVDGEIKEEDMSADTRTFIYEEVIVSAIDNGYVLCGRTPARGNDDVFFAENRKGMRYGERFYNELCHPNIFTWLGLIGMILYSFIYLRASSLAVYHSNSLIMKILGVFVAFRWFFGWIEDMNTFNIWNVSLWMIIGMCMSPYFRQMSEKEMKKWLVDCFK